MAEINDKNIDANVSRENISYYNEMAGNYDDILAEDVVNEQVRQSVSQIFCNTISAGLVLDFGGGTGCDLDWLTHQNYSIIFCEPAQAMRQKAIDRNYRILHNPSIDFLETDKTDFRTWNNEIPFPEKVDAVLANFAVVNCIPDTNLLFESLGLVTKPGAHFFALVLNSSFKKRLKSNLRGSLLSIFKGGPVRLNVHYKEKQHTAYIHSKRSLKKSAASSFSFEDIKLLPGSGFALLHLIRK